MKINIDKPYILTKMILKTKYIQLDREFSDRLIVRFDLRLHA